MVATAAEDPFDVFGDSDDDDDQEQETEASRIASSLVDQANRQTQKLQQPDGVETPHSSAIHTEDQQELSLEFSGMDPLIIPWEQPLYLGPMKLVTSLSYGGGRGYVASRNLPAGTLLLLERPVITFPADEWGEQLDLPSVLRIFEHPDAARIIHDMEHFHPTKLAVDGKEESSPEQVVSMLDRLRSQREEGDEALQTLAGYASEANLENKDGSSLTETDVLRLLLALRYNGLETGVYLHVAMLNHADQPNCVKFLPTPDKSYSEVRTTQAVQAGEPLMISYLPRILSHATRRKHLWEQHRFDIAANLAPGLRKMEQIGNQLPPSAVNIWDEESTTNRIETATGELEEHFQDASEQMEEGQVLAPESAELVKALEQASLVLFTAAVDQLQNENHLLLIPCLRLHLDSCDLVQRDASLTAFQRVQLLCRMVVTARKLVALQESFHGHDHFDLARTNLDLAQAVEELLATSSTYLIALALDGLGTSSAWSVLEHRCRKEYERVSGLYPHDAEMFIEP